MSKGIDVSSYQGIIDWNKVFADGITFAFIKATEGTGWDDPNFITNFSQAKKAGVKRGAYHFGHPNNDPIAEASHFISRLNGDYGDLPLTLDIEVTNGKTPAEITAWTVKFLDYVHSQTNHPVQYYTYTRFLQLNLNLDSLSEYPLWIANYAATAGVDGYSIWQYSDAGVVNGINGKVDMNITGQGGVVTLTTLLQVGDSGTAVRTLQEELNKAGASLVPDGQFGPATEQAVKAFQTKHGLTADGVVGPLTELQLRNVISPPVTPVPETKPPDVTPKPEPAPTPQSEPAPKQGIDKAHLAAIILMILGAAKPILQSNGITFPNVDLNQVSNLVATIAISAGAIWASFRHNATK